MELKEFIKKVVLDVDGALKELYDETGIPYSLGNDREKTDSCIAFDVGVSLKQTDKDGKEGGGSIQVANIFSIGGKKTIGQESENIATHRIKFEVKDNPKRGSDGLNVRRHEGREYYNHK